MYLKRENLWDFVPDVGILSMVICLKSSGMWDISASTDWANWPVNQFSKGQRYFLRNNEQQWPHNKTIYLEGYLFGWIYFSKSNPCVFAKSFDVLIYPPMAKSTISMSIDSDNFPIKGYQRVPLIARGCSHVSNIGAPSNHQRSWFWGFAICLSWRLPQFRETPKSTFYMAPLTLWSMAHRNRSFSPFKSSCISGIVHSYVKQQEGSFKSYRSSSLIINHDFPY